MHIVIRFIMLYYVMPYDQNEYGETKKNTLPQDVLLVCRQ